MTLEELLNSEMDLDSLAALARQGLAWWIDELSAMLPTAWRERLSSRPRTWIEPKPAGGWRVWKDGRLTEATPARGPKAPPIGIVVPPEIALVREIVAPRMPPADVRRMLSLDIDRLSPLAPELIHFDLEVIERDGEDGRQKVLLALLPRSEAERLWNEALRDGYEPKAMALGVVGEPGRQRFNFLPQTLAGLGVAGGSRRRVYAWWAAVALIVVNLGVLVGRDIIDVSRVSQAVDGQKPVVDAVLRLRRRVETEDARRRDLIAQGRKNDPLRLLDTLSQALPPGVWTQHLEWNGQTLRIVGFKPQDIDVAAALRGSGAFTNPRAQGNGPTAGPTAIRPFDITTDARPEPRP
jgi:general secretion pathway protein L